MTNKHIVAVVGNPNCGKTTLFNLLTGTKQDVGNWPGVTVEKKVGHYSFDGDDVDLVDLPGIYSIVPNSTSGEDERVARDYILTDEADCIINILDASNLERNLFLTAQLIEMRVPMLVIVNMLDVAKQHKIEIDLKALQDKLGCPVIGITATRDKSRDVKEKIHEFLKSPVMPPMAIRFADEIEQSAAEVSTVLSKMGVKRPHWFALQLLEDAPGIETKLPAGSKEAVAPIKDKLDKLMDYDTDIAISDARYQFVGDVSEVTIIRQGEVSHTLTDKIDRIVLNRWLGLPIFLFIMYVMFLFTQNLGGSFNDFFDIVVGGITVDGFGGWLQSIGAPDWLRAILANGIGGGIQTVSTFIPVIFFLYLFLSVLEDSGYMARAAFVMDRFMRAIGLPGKAFVPLIVGFGCNVPAIMATRTMDRASDRIITIMMAPFMSCGARLPVYVLFAAAFFPNNGQNLVFLMYIIGIFAAILTGFLMKNVALPGEASAFVMEIPPYHIPTIKGVLLRTWDRLKAFLGRAGKVIVLIVAVLGFLNSLGTDGTFGHEDTDESVLAYIGKTITPVFKPMGLHQDNWPAAVGVFTGIFAKEAVVGTLNNLYDGMAAQAAAKEAAEGGDAAPGEENSEDEGFSLKALLSEGISTTMDNLSGLKDSLVDPFDFGSADNLEDTKEAAENLEVTVDSISQMRVLFGSGLAAFCYLLIVLLYMPCVAAIAAVYREAGLAWMLFTCVWTTLLGYGSAVTVYQVGTFSQHPGSSLSYIAIAVGLLASVMFGMRKYVQTQRHLQPQVITIHPKR